MRFFWPFRSLAPAIFEAALAGDDAALAAALKKRPPVRSYLQNGRDALCVAASAGHWRCVELLAPLCDPKRADSIGVTALMLAAMAGCERSVRLLLPLSDPLAVDSEGRCALTLACDRAESDCVAALASKEAGALVDSKGDSCLHFAAYSLSSLCVKAALPACDPNLLDRGGHTALMLAASFGAEQCVRALAPLTDTRARSFYNGFDALDLAVLGRHSDCAHTLLPLYRDLGTPQAAACAARARSFGMLDIALALEGGSLSMIERQALGAATLPGASAPAIARL